MKPVIFGLAGTEILAEERALFRACDPAGYILFKRNIESPHQLRALTCELRALSGRDWLPILIDQEGGRVARMQPPTWPAFPPAGEPFGRLYARAPMTAIEAARANAEAIALMLSEVGITVNCLPLLDVRQPGADAIIGDRSFGSDPLMVAALGRAVLDGMAAGGVIGVVKHMPGHGRAVVDSHVALPIVDSSAEELEADIAPFAKLSDAAMGMTAHIVYTIWDKHRPATLSPVVIDEVIRGKIGFGGLLMSDDIDMKALSGSAGEKAEAVIAAGCDLVLHCGARMDEMAQIADRLASISDASRLRLDRARQSIGTAPRLERRDALIAKRDQLLEMAA